MHLPETPRPKASLVPRKWEGRTGGGACSGYFGLDDVDVGAALSLFRGLGRALLAPEGEAAAREWRRLSSCVMPGTPGRETKRRAGTGTHRGERVAGAPSPGEGARETRPGARFPPLDQGVRVPRHRCPKGPVRGACGVDRRAVPPRRGAGRMRRFQAVQPGGVCPASAAASPTSDLSGSRSGAAEQGRCLGARSPMCGTDTPLGRGQCGRVAQT